MKILILRGLQGSGKSTFAKQWVSEDPEHRIRINCDDIRAMLGTYWVPKREPLVWDTYKDILVNGIQGSYDIVVDNMNLNEKYISDIKTIVRRIKPEYEIEVKDFFHIPLSVCIERDSKRERPVGELAIRNTYNRYKNKIVPWKYLN